MKIKNNNQKISIKQMQTKFCRGSILLFAASLFLKKIPSQAKYIPEQNIIKVDAWHDRFEIIAYCFIILCILLFVISIIVSVITKVRKKEKIFKGIFVSSGLMIISCLMITLSNINVIGIWKENDYCPEYYNFTNGNYTIVIEEKSFLLYGGGTIYQIRDNNKAVNVGTISTDDGCRNCGNYEIEWFDGYANITYNDFTSEGHTTTKKIILN